MSATRRTHLLVGFGGTLAVLVLLLWWLGASWPAGGDDAGPLAWDEIAPRASLPTRAPSSEIERLVLDVEGIEGGLEAQGASTPLAEDLLGFPGVVGYPFPIHVVDAVGDAVAGAEVEVGDESPNASGFEGSNPRLWRSLGRTGDDGRLIVPPDSLRVERNGDLTLRARAAGFLRAPAEAKVSDLYAVLVLYASETARVEVTSAASGRALEGATVRVLAGQGDPTLEEYVLHRTATDGAGFAFIQAAPGPRFRLSVSAPGFQPWTAPLDSAEEVHRVALAPGRAVRVSVRAADEQGVSGARVRLAHRNTRDVPMSVETDAEGEAWFDQIGLAWRSVQIRATHPKFGTAKLDVELSETAEVNEFMLRFAPSGGLLIAPLTGVAKRKGFTVDIVLADVVMPEWVRVNIPLHWDEATLVEGLPVGIPLHVACYWQRDMVALREHVVLEEGVVTPLRFDLPESSPVRVTVRGHPRQVAHGWVIFQALDGRTESGFEACHTPVEKPFYKSVAFFGDVVLGLPEGDYEVSFISHAGCKATTTLRVAGPGLHEVGIDCGSEASFRSRLVLRDGTPAAGQWLLLAGPAFQQRARTDEDGVFEFDAIGDAEVRLEWLGSRGHAHAILARGRLALEGAASYVLDACRVRGRVFLPEGSPAGRGVRIKAERTDDLLPFISPARAAFRPPGEQREPVTDVDGTFELLLSPGSWTLFAQGGSESQSFVKLVVAGEDCPPLVDLALIPTEEVVFRRGGETSYLEVAVWDLSAPHPHEQTTWPLRADRNELKLRLPAGAFRYSILRRADPVLSSLPGARPTSPEPEILISSTFVIRPRGPNEILLP